MAIGQRRARAAIAPAGPAQPQRRLVARTWYLFDIGPLAAEVAELRELHPSDAADRVRSMPYLRLKQIVAAMDDEHLADVLAELPDDEQVGIIEGLGLDARSGGHRALDPDDAADLLAEMPEDERMQLLAAMDDEDATPVRRLMSYGQKTAGGLMTSDPLILRGLRNGRRHAGRHA